MMLLVDIFVCTPVTVFLVWLYLRSRPKGRPTWLRVVDTTVLVAAPAAGLLILVGGHAWADWEGMGLNVMLVASTYIAVVGLLSIGWAVRAAWRRRVGRL